MPRRNHREVSYDHLTIENSDSETSPLLGLAREGWFWAGGTGLLALI
jgi:hypothetical protein